MVVAGGLDPSAFVRRIRLESSGLRNRSEIYQGRTRGMLVKEVLSGLSDVERFG